MPLRRLTTPAATLHTHTLIHDPPTLAVLLYILLASTSSLLDIYIGSLSEYRFPHSLTATCLHLFLALLLLLSTSLIARLALRLSRRPDRLPALVTLASLTSSSSSPYSRRRRRLLPSPSACLATLFSVGAALLDRRLSHTASIEFLSFVKLLPLFLSFVVAPFLPGSIRVDAGVGKSSASAVVVGLVLLGGAGVTSRGHLGEWAFGVGWAVGIVGWVVAVKKLAPGRGVTVESEEAEDAVEDGQVEEGKRLSSPSPPLPIPPPPSSAHPTLPSLLLSHLFLSLSLLLPLLLLPVSPYSTEIASLQRYRHWTFFTEVGFWAQEAGMAGCEVVRLAVFLNVARTCSVPTTLSLPPLSSLLLRPLLTHLLFGNPLPSDGLYLGGEGLVGEWTQLALIAGVGVWAALGEGRERKGKRGRRRKEV